MKAALAEELSQLIKKIVNAGNADSGVELHVMNYLKKILAELERPGSVSLLMENFSGLRQFWLESIPWCSELSRDIEKIIMMYEELKG